MATLDATFKLYDKYTSTIDKINYKTDQATNKIMRASNQTDSFNMALSSTGASANKASSGLGKLITLVGSYVSALKGMQIADEYTNTGARLNLINDGLQTQAELQKEIFDSAERARGSYTKMASAISKMGMLAGDAFSSNGELISFTELIQKSFKVGGASKEEQDSALLQLTQAMASGRLQGDEYRSITENAPMIAQAIALYTGKSKGELKQMSADGEITADIIKNAMFAMSDDINDKFEDMPKTFSDVWNHITNMANRMFGPLLTRVNNIINSDKFNKFIDDVVMGFDIAAKGADKALDAVVGLYDLVANNGDKITDIVLAGAAAWGAYKLAVMGVTAVQWISALTNPITLSIVLVAALAAAFVLLWEKCEWFRKMYVSMWKTSALITVISYNAFVGFFNLLGSGFNSSMTAMGSFVDVIRAGMIAAVNITSSSISSMIKSFGFLIDMIGSNIDAYNAMAGVFGMKKIDFKVNTDNLNKILSSVTGNAINTINSAYTGVSGVIDKSRINNPLKPMDIGQAMAKINYAGGKIEDFTVTGWLKGIFGDASAAIKDFLKSKDNDPITVAGTGSNGALKVDMSDEDLQYLRDIAEREYINKFSTATLAPNITVSFGDVHETADVNAIHGRIKKILQEEIAISAEG